MLPCGRRGRGAGNRGRLPPGLPPAIHPFGRPAPAFRQGAFQPDYRRPGPAHSGGARHAPITQPKQRRSIMVAQPKTVEPTIVNGINLDDLFALIDGAKRGAAQAKTKWRLTTTWQGQTRS